MKAVLIVVKRSLMTQAEHWGLRLRLVLCYNSELSPRIKCAIAANELLLPSWGHHLFVQNMIDTRTRPHIHIFIRITHSFILNRFCSSQRLYINIEWEIRPPDNIPFMSPSLIRVYQMHLPQSNMHDKVSDWGCSQVFSCNS